MTVTNKDIYTVIKSKLPNDTEFHTDNHFFTSVTLGKLRDNYDGENQSINKDLMNQINKLKSKEPVTV